VLRAILVAIAIIVRARRPGGALEVAGEGPALGARPALGDGVKLVFFTAEGCRLCRALLPQAERLGAVIFDKVADAAAWTAADVPGAPCAIALAADGTVLAKGTVNTRRQLASVPATARAGDGAHPEPRLIGNVAIEVRLEDGEPRVLAGFENHGGRTHLGEGEQPLGRVLKGAGRRAAAARPGGRRGRCPSPSHP
jgi:hypothetical protein